MKIILLIIFFSGSRAAFFDWKQSYNQLCQYREVIRNGFNRDNYFIPPCTCGNCDVSENALLEKTKEAHNQMMKDLREQTIVNVMHTMFETSITIAAIYYYITLTLNN